VQQGGSREIVPGPFSQESAEKSAAVLKKLIDSKEKNRFYGYGKRVEDEHKEMMLPVELYREGTVAYQGWKIGGLVSGIP